jgi:fructoselysine 6-kinase
MTVSGFEVAAIGDNCIDRYLAVGLDTVGGNAVNVAVQLAIRGRRAAYFGAAGDGAQGRRTRAALVDNGVDVAGLRIVAGRTAYTDLKTTPEGDRVIAFEDFGVCRGYRPDPAEVAALHAARHVHFGWFDDGGALKRELAAAGVAVSQDLAVNGGADGLTIAFASAGASREQARALMQHALSAGARLAVVTCGELGSVASDGRRFAETGVAPVEVTDTTGAGDTFIAAFIDAHLKGLDLPECLAAGRDAAALTCRHLGGFPQRPQPLTPM